MKSHAYYRIAVVQAVAGDVEGSKATAAQIGDETLQAQIYRAIARKHAKAGDAAARENPEKVKKEGDLNSWLPRCIPHTQLKAGDVAGAIASINDVTDNAQQRCECLTDFAKELCDRSGHRKNRRYPIVDYDPRSPVMQNAYRLQFCCAVPHDRFGRR